LRDAVTDCELFDCSVAFFSPECWNVEVLPLRDETPGVYLRVPSSSTDEVTPMPARLKVRDPFVPLVETRAPRPL
jgi:hypothetical protein